MNQFQTGQDHCADNSHKQQIASLFRCTCDQPQMRNHIVESWQLTKLADDGGLLQLHSADDDVVVWLKDLITISYFSPFM